MKLESLRTPALVLACGCIIMTITFGVRAGFGLFLQPMSLEYGWGREVFSLSMALQNLAWGALGAVAGGVADRWGPGRVIAGAAVCYILGLIGMSVISSPLGMYVNCGLLLGMALGGASFGIILAIIGRTVAPEKRSFAMGIATSAGSFGQFALLPLTQFLIPGDGWLALIGLCNIVGTLCAGYLGGRFSKKYLLSTIYAIRGVLIAMLVFLPLTPIVLYVFACGIGLLWLGTVPLTNGLVGQIFGMRYAAMLASIVFFGHQIGSFIGVWLAGYLYDTTGAYSGAFYASIGLGLFAAIINLPVNEKPLTERKPALAPP